MKLINAILSRMDIDPEQWRTLVSMNLKLLRRNKSAFIVKSSKTKKEGFGSSALVLPIFLYGVMGIMFAVIFGTSRSVGVASFLVFSIIFFLIAMSMLLEFVGLMVYPEDVSILGYRPVSSRTYFAAKISFVLMVILSYAAALSLPSAIACLYKFGAISAIAWLFTVVCGSLSIVMLMIAVYTMLVSHVRPEKVRSIMGYVQLIFSFLFYGGYMLIPKLADKFHDTTSLAAWTIILPTSWYSSITAIASGEATRSGFFSAGFAISVTVILTWVIGKKVSLSYSETVAGASIQTAHPTPVSKSSRFRFHFFKRPEDRAVAMLITQQFRYDIKFKIAVLSILPLTVFYLFQGMAEGKSLVDPFSVAYQANPAGSSMLFYIAIILFPSILKGEIIQNDMFDASWIFFSAPVDRGRLIQSTHRILVRTFVIPYLTVVALAFLWFFKNPMHVLMHVAVLYLSCDIFLSILFMNEPALPFSRPRVVGNRLTSVVVIMFLGILFFIIFISAFMKFLYPSGTAYLIGLAFLIITSMSFRFFLSKRLGRRGRELEYAG